MVVAASTRRLLGGLFALTDLGPVRLKGFAEPLAAWRVEGEGRAESRFEAMHGQQPTTLVGREHEIGLLTDRWSAPTKARARWCCFRVSRGSGNRGSCARCANGSRTSRTRRSVITARRTTPTARSIPSLGSSNAPPASRETIGLRRRLDKLVALLSRSHRGARRGRAARGCPARDRDRAALPGTGADPAAPEAAHPQGTDRPSRGPGGPEAGARGLRGRALGRSPQPSRCSIS